MKKKAFLVFAALYIPVFGSLLAGFRARSNTLSYLPVIVLFSIFAYRAWKRPVKIKPYSLTLFFCLIFLGTGLFHWALSSDELTSFLYSNFGFFLSLSLLVYVSTIDDAKKPLFFNALFNMIGSAFILQFALSAYESNLARYIGYQSEGWNVFGFQYFRLGERFIFNAIIPGIGNMIFGNRLVLAFTGLLGQHNYWGTQLPFYNLIFIMAFLQRRKTKDFVLLSLVLLASILNTSRFGMFAILLTDLAVAARMIRFRGDQGGFFKASVVIIFLLLFAGFLPFLAEGWSSYFRTQDTLSYRLSRYPVFASIFFSASPVNLLIGSSAGVIKKQITSSTGNIGSFESQALLIAYNYGLIGLGVAVYWLGSLLRQARRYSYFWKFFTYLLLFNILAVSATSNLLFHFSSLPFVMLLYMYLRSSAAKPHLYDARNNQRQEQPVNANDL